MSLSIDDRKSLVDYRIENEETTEEEITEAMPKVKALVKKLISINRIANRLL